MAVKAAIHSGVGLVTAFVPESLVASFAAAAPEAMWVGWPEPRKVDWHSKVPTYGATNWIASQRGLSDRYGPVGREFALRQGTAWFGYCACGDGRGRPPTQLGTRGDGAANPDASRGGVGPHLTTRVGGIVRGGNECGGGREGSIDRRGGSLAALLFLLRRSGFGPGRER
jgi:hypothetical protein